MADKLQTRVSTGFISQYLCNIGLSNLVSYSERAVDGNTLLRVTRTLGSIVGFFAVWGMAVPNETLPIIFKRDPFCP